MGRKYFGTDGVRGQVGQHPMTVEFALRLASKLARLTALLFAGEKDRAPAASVRFPSHPGRI